MEALEEFLGGVNPKFTKYAEPILEAGLTDPEELAEMEENDFKHLGVPIFHWRKILAAAKAQYSGEADIPPSSQPDTGAYAPTTASDPSPGHANAATANGYNNNNNNDHSNNAMNDWGAEEVALFVRTLDKGAYNAEAQVFLSKNIDGETCLSYQSVKHLSSIVTDLGARYAIWGAIEKCQAGDVPEIPQLLRLDKQFNQGNEATSRKTSTGPSIAASDWGGGNDNHANVVIAKAGQQTQFTVANAESTVKQRLKKFYQIYNPEKLADEAGIDALLRSYQGRDQQLFRDLETKYILSQPKLGIVKKKVLNVKTTSKTDIVLHKLWALYSEFIRDIEAAYEFPKFHTPLLDEVDFLAKPMVMLVGQYSVGKTSFIRYLVGRDFPGIRIGPEPTTDAFGCIMWGREERMIPGHTVPMDRTKPFRSLQNFGAGFLNKFGCAELPAPILESITFIDTPGILSGTKQRLGRNYDFAKVVEWFAYRCDRILLLFDAHKLDISDEFKAAIMMLKGHDDKIRCILNKADAVTNQQLLRVYGALMWSLGKVFKTPEVLRVYVGSFWDEDYKNAHNAELFDSEASDLISDLKGLPRHCATRKINEFVKRTRQMEVHAMIIEHMRQQFGFFANKNKKQTKMLANLRGQFKAIAKNNGLNLNDFPNPDKFKVLVQKHDISKFPKFNAKWRAKFKQVLNHEIPDLMNKLPSQTSGDDEKSGGGGNAANPFADDNGRGFAKIDGAAKWAVTGVEKAKFDTKFYELSLNKGFASGNQVMNIMLQSGLSKTVLRNIWKLSDIDQDGAMDHEEFATCMYLIGMVKGGVKLPPTLPVSLIPPGKRHLVEYQ